MTRVFGIVSLILNFIVGIICLFMAYTNIRTKKFLPFHEEAAGKKWEELEAGMQETYLALTRLSGLGFLIIGLLLTVVDLIANLQGNRFALIFIPILSILFCGHLALINFRLHSRTKANTPWQSSIVSLVVLVVAFLAQSILL